MLDPSILTAITACGTFMLYGTFTLMSNIEKDRWTTITIPIKQSTKDKLKQKKSQIEDISWDELMQRAVIHEQVPTMKRQPNLFNLKAFASNT